MKCRVLSKATPFIDALSTGCALTLAVLLLGSSPLAAADWPHFGYDDQYTSFLPGKTKINAGNVHRLQRKWGLMCDEPSLIALYGSPAYYRGTVYAQVSGSPLMSLNSCGSVGWESGEEDFWQISQPALSQDGVIFHFAHDMQTSNLLAFNRSGKHLWTAPPAFDYTRDEETTSVPTVDEAKKVVYVVENTFFKGEGKLYALSKATGKVLWFISKDSGGVGFRAPYALLKGNSLFVKAQTGEWYDPENIVRVNASTRKVDLVYDAPKDYEPRRYCLGNDTLLVEYEKYSQGLVAAYKMNSRKVVWQKDFWGRSVTGSMACNTKLKRVYVPAESFLYALDLKTGKEIWSHVGLSDIRSPSIANGVIYFLAGRQMVALNEATGKKLFSYDLGGDVKPNVQVAIGENAVYLWGSADTCGLLSLWLPGSGPRCETKWGVYNTLCCTPSGSTTFSGTIAGATKTSSMGDCNNPATWEGYAATDAGKVTFSWTLTTTCAGNFGGTWTPAASLAADTCYCFIGALDGSDVAVGLFEMVGCGVPSEADGTPPDGWKLIERMVIPVPCPERSSLKGSW